MPEMKFLINREGSLEEVEINLVPPDQHPTNDPTLPSYRHPVYQEMLPILTFVKDMQDGAMSWMNINGTPKHLQKCHEYLPPFSKEDEDDYLDRLKLSHWIGFFKEPLEEYPGYIKDLEISPSVFQGLKVHQHDIDLKQNSLRSFGTLADSLVIRDLTCFVLVDWFTKIPGEKINDANLTQSVNRPFLKLIDRRDFIFWEGDVRDFDKVVILENCPLPLGSPLPYFTQYREIKRDGSTTVYTLVKDGSEIKAIVLDQRKNTLGCIPLVTYSLDEINPLGAYPPLLNVADLQKAHYQLSSEDRVATHKQGFSTLVTTGLFKPGLQKNQPREQRLGVSTGVDLPQDGDAKYISPDHNWANVFENRLAAIRAEADRQSLKFIGHNPQNTISTATQANLVSTGAKSHIQKMLESKVTMLDRVEMLWAKYYGKTLEHSSDRNSNFKVIFSLGEVAPGATQA